MKSILKSKRLPLLWRTIFLLTIFVVISQAVIYIWVQRSVSDHFDQMDTEMLTHAAFNLRKRVNTFDEQATLSNVLTLSSPADTDYLNASWLDYDLKTLVFDKNGVLLSSAPSSFVNFLPKDFDILPLWTTHGEQQFSLTLKARNYRVLIIENNQTLALIALPTDVHRQYLIHFNRQLSVILAIITLLLVSVAAMSVYWGFAPLSTIMRKMKDINPEHLDERVVVKNMPSELRPLAESYNLMMETLESNFESLSRFSDNIAHELRTPIATLSTHTQVMLSKDRERREYIEQLHCQHDTLKQMSTLINNMLLLAKTKKGLSNSQLHHIDTESMLNKLLSYYELIAEDRGVFLEKVGNFPAVLGDDSLLQRLFSNLISNAIYYAASDSIISIEALVPEAAISTHTTKSTNLQNSSLSVLNHPVFTVMITNLLDEPMTQAEADKLFERFHRHHKVDSMQSGSGLGLSIAQTIAHAHKGSISIKIKEDYYFQVSIKLLIDQGV